MIFFVLILLLIVFSSISMSKPNEFNRDYISRDGTNYIKGIFVILILLSHGKGYISLDSVYDEPYIAMQNHLNQMVVALFLFYSGYGIMEQIKKRRFDYIKSIPRKRFPNLLLNYDIAVLLFVLLNVILGKPNTLKQIVLSLIAWDGIGNSSWYIFITFALYLITFVSFLLIRFIKNPKADIIFVILLTALSVGLIYVMMHYTEKERFWYNTLILYALGFWYSYFKDTIEKIVMRNDIIYFLAVTAVTGVYILTYLRRWDRFLMYEIWAVMFTLLVVLITMKVKLGSQVLKWFGEHIFSIYILQRLPMIFLHEMGVSSRHKYLFLIASYVITVLMALIYDNLTGKLGKAIWGPKKKITENKKGTV